MQKRILPSAQSRNSRVAAVSIRETHKEEKSAQMKAYYQAHKVEMKAKSRKYDKTHPENRQAYLENNKEKIKARYVSNKEKINEYSIKWQKDNPDKAKVIRRRTVLKCKYGITPEDWDTLFNEQGRKCAVCASLVTTGNGWNTDHDHITGKVRGILCLHCNTLLGYAKDDVDTLRAAAMYIETFRKALEIAKTCKYTAFHTGC